VVLLSRAYFGSVGSDSLVSFIIETWLKHWKLSTLFQPLEAFMTEQYDVVVAGAGTILITGMGVVMVET
jgi:hypothetical protein